MYPMIRDDFGAKDTPEAADERLRQQPVGVGEALASQAGQTTGDLMRFAKHATEPEPFFRKGDIQSPQELNEQYGLKGENQFKNWMHSDTAAEIVDALHKRQKAEEVYSRFSAQHNAVTRLGVSFVGSMLDPVEAAAMFVPGIGEERIAYKLATMGYGKQAAAFMSKVGAGASAGMAGAAALEPLKAVMSEDELKEWHLRDALTDVFAAAPAGALMHAGLVPAIRGAASHIPGVKPAPYVHDYSFWDKDDTTSEEMARQVQLGIKGGVQAAFGNELAKQPPSFGHIDELARMSAIENHVFKSSTFAQLISWREPNAGEHLFPDHSEQARRLAPEAHAEWDKLQEELSSIHAGHVWGEAPTPEQINDPAWRLEQELRDHVRNILPVSWDLRVAAGELPAPGEGGMAHLAETPAEHTVSPGKPANLSDVKSDPSLAFQVVDNKGASHSINVQEATDGHGKAVEFTTDNAKVKLEQRPDGRWEVAWMTVEKAARGSGLMGKIYDAIEREYGNQMIPSGLLRESGFNFWKKRNPELVKYHQQVEGYGSDYHSPRFIKEQIAELQQDLNKAKAAKNASRVADIQEDMQAWRNAWNKIPAEGKSPEAIKAMYSFGGVKAAKPPKGLKAAQEMERRGHRKEDIWQDTGWHRSPTGGWRFEIDDSKMVINEKSLLVSSDGERLFRNKIPLGELIDHPELFKQYPSLKNMTVRFIVDPNLQTEYGGRYSPQGQSQGKASFLAKGRTMTLAETTLIHEIQHAIQHIEGESWKFIGGMADSHKHRLYNTIIDDVSKTLPLWDRNKVIDEVRYAIYQHNDAEIESRAAERRVNFTEGARKVYPPFADRNHFYNQEVVHKIVVKHLKTDIFNIDDYFAYIDSPEYKAKQKEIADRNARVRAALDERRAKIETEKGKATAEVDEKQRLIDKAKAEEVAAKQKAEAAKQRADAIRAADAEVVRTEAQAKKAQDDLDKFMKRHHDELMKAEKARQAAVQAEGDLHKANERLKVSEADMRAAEREHAKALAEEEAARQEMDDARAVVEAVERERLDAARAREGETIVAQGMTDPAKRTAWISAMAVDPRLVAREESGHAIRASGLFKPEDWGILRDAAINRGWIDDMPKAVQERYHEAYADRGPDGVRDAMVEEAIMHRFAKGPEAWGEAGGPIARFMQRIKELLERVGNWMTSRGFQSASDVFRAMDEGKISSRDTMPAHPARRASEIEARMEELRPTITEAYRVAKDNSPHDIPSLASLQRTRAAYGEAPAMPQGQLTKALEQIYGPKEERKLTPAKPGEVPIELQLDEQRFQSMMEEGYKPDPDEVSNHLKTQRALQEALAMEQGYQQAAECLITAGMR